MLKTINLSPRQQRTTFLTWTAATAVAATAAAGLLGACGGGDGRVVGADPTQRTGLIGAATVVAPLLADDGSVMPSDPRAEPADAAAWTEASHYATVRQARMLTGALGDGVFQVEVECCGIEAVDRAVGIMWGLQASYSLPGNTPVLVRGADLRLAAAAANRLASGGMTHVWLVTP